MTSLIKLFANALMPSPCQQSKLNIAIIAISALNDLAVKVAVYMFLYTDSCKLPYMQKWALNFIRNPLVSVL